MKVYSKKLFDERHVISLSVKVRFYMAEVLSALLYGVESLPLTAGHLDYLRQHHCRHLQRLLGFKKKEYTDHPLAYHIILKKTKCESIEATIRRRRILEAGRILRMSDDRLPKMMLFGELAAGKRRVGGQLKTWRRCLREDLATFEIDVESWQEAALDAVKWSELVDIGAEHFMHKWHQRKLQTSAAKHDARRRVAEAALPPDAPAEPLASVPPDAAQPEPPP